MAAEQKSSQKATTAREKRKKNKKIILTKAVAHVHSSFNNTIVAISNEKGEVITWSSGGALGYKGSKKSTPYVAQMVADACLKSVKDYGVKEMDILVSGVGPGRDAAVRGLQQNTEITSNVRDITNPPYNGCRKPRKPRK